MRRARHRAQGDDPDQPFDHPLFHHKCDRWRETEAGRNDAEGNSFRQRQGHQGSRGFDRWRKDLDTGKARQGSRKIFVPGMDAAGEARGRRTRTQGSRDKQCRRHAAERAAVESGGLFAQRRRNRSHHRGMRRPAMTRSLLLATAAIAGLNLGSATAAFKPGPNLDVVQNNCTACHSADYISTQPRGHKKDFWQAEVTKMIKIYGAPIDDADVGKIVDYLAATY